MRWETEKIQVVFHEADKVLVMKVWVVEEEKEEGDRERKGTK